MSDVHWFHRDNPLLAQLPKYGSIQEISSALTHEPLVGLDVTSLSELERDELLVGEKVPLAPTMQSVRAAMTIIGMVRHSLRIRNPVLASARFTMNQTIEVALTGLDYLKLPTAPGACLLVIKGITGVSKTVTLKRTLVLLGPQVIRHGAVEGALWHSATQLVHLFVGMSHDGSRGGFLNAILIAIDRVLGTTYATDLPRQYKSIERLAGAVIALLHSLFLGVLVIDECQVLNMVLSEHSEKMQLFLHNLINSGIPVVLAGNPSGFAWLPHFSQDLSRSIERESIFFHPCGAVGSSEDDEWDIVFGGVRAYYLLDRPPVDEEGCSRLLKRLSGGIPRVALSLWCIAQRDALLDGGNSISPDDLQAVYDSEGFKDALPLVDGFSTKNPSLLMGWRDSDIPVDFYARVWGKPLPGDSARTPPIPIREKEPHGGATKPKRSGGKGMSPAARLKAQQTREKNKQAARERLTQSLNSEDMRIAGLKQHSVASLNELLKSIDATQGKSGTNSVD